MSSDRSLKVCYDRTLDNLEGASGRVGEAEAYIEVKNKAQLVASPREHHFSPHDAADMREACQNIIREEAARGRDGKKGVEHRHPKSKAQE